MKIAAIILVLVCTQGVSMAKDLATTTCIFGFTSSVQEMNSGILAEIKAAVNDLASGNI